MIIICDTIKEMTETVAELYKQGTAGKVEKLGNGNWQIVLTGF